MIFCPYLNAKQSIARRFFMSYTNFYQDFIAKLKIPESLPRGVEVLFPFEGQEVVDMARTFYNRYYNDSNPRTMLIGINPGRFGAGVTGIPFTDPIRLQANCDIDNQLEKRQELSSVFIYDMIEQFGGPEEFYRHFFFSSVSPLGFVKDGKNLNYYDDKTLQRHLEPFMVNSLKKQLNLGARRDISFSLGMGKNHKFLLYLNKKHGFFRQIKPLHHPRWIMQYRLKSRDSYLEEYVRELSAVL